MKRRNLSLKECISTCLPWTKRSRNFFNCVRMSMKTNKVTCRRKVIVKGLFGVKHCFYD